MDLTEVYRIFHPAVKQYIFFPAAHGTFSKIDYNLGHKVSLNKHKKIEFIALIHSAIKLEFNDKSSSRKYANNWRVKNTSLNDQQITEEMKGN
jgi:hypothetical protein